MPRTNNDGIRIKLARPAPNRPDVSDAALATTMLGTLENLPESINGRRDRVPTAIAAAKGAERDTEAASIRH